MTEDINDVSRAIAHPALVVVAAALIDREGRVLMQQRPAGRQHAGLWEFPGGKLEPCEGPLAALVRELGEELAIEVAADDCSALGFAAEESSESARAIVLLLYACRTWRGEPISQDGAQIAWCRPDTLHALAMPPLDIPLAALVSRFVADAL